MGKSKQYLVVIKVQSIVFKYIKDYLFIRVLWN